MSKSMSLWNIEESLEQLTQLIAQAEDEGDSETLKVLETELANYLERVPEKIEAIGTYMRKLEVESLAAQDEADRCASIADAKHKRLLRVKANTLATMQRFNVNFLEVGTTRIWRQANGGVQGLEIAQAECLPKEFQNVTVTMPRLFWEGIALRLERFEGHLDSVSADTKRIRERLKEMVRCEKCKGVGAEWNNSAAPACEACDGKGVVPAAVAGARLLPKGEHIRVK